MTLTDGIVWYPQLDRIMLFDWIKDSNLAVCRLLLQQCCMPVLSASLFSL